MRMRKVLLLIGHSRGYDQGLLKGIARYSNLHGDWIFIQKPQPYLSKRFEAIKLMSRGGDGVNGIIASEAELTDAVLKSGLPTIIIDPTKEYSRLPVAFADHVTVGKTVAEYFISRGFKHYAYCGYEQLKFSNKREESFAKCLLEKGYQTNLFRESKKSSQRSVDAFKSLANWLNSLPKPVALMACNDERGSDLLEACRLAGLSVPEHIAVLGVDDDRLICELSSPPLSSVPLNTEKAGYEIAEVLDSMMKGENLNGKVITVLPKQVVTRQSTDILAIDDAQVSLAIRFIREKARDEIQVSDVVDATMLSKRVLQQRFKKALGRSISDEIRRIRMDLVGKMLVETNLTVSQISQKLDFVDFEHIGRYFKKQMGMSPTEYRKKHGLSSP